MGTEVVLTSTHNLCFRAKTKNNVYPVNPSFTIYIKEECKGVYITRTCNHDDLYVPHPFEAILHVI